MVVYIEYVFLENMLLDFALMSVSLKVAKENVKYKRLLLSSSLGGLFAVISPLISINAGGRYALKLLFGAFMCFLLVFPIKSKKGWGRYAFICISFYFCTFCFAGFLSAFHAESFWIWIEFFLSCLFCAISAHAFYKRKKYARFLYVCQLFIGEKQTSTVGYFDSGNLAEYQGVPVCLLSPEIAYSLLEFSCEALYENKQTITIRTLSGAKQVPIFLGEILLTGEHKKKRVYFAIVGNMVNREHKLILHSKILEKDG